MSLSLGLTLLNTPLSLSASDAHISTELPLVPTAYHSGIRTAADAAATTESTTGDAIITLLAGLDYWWSANASTTGTTSGNAITTWDDWVSNASMTESGSGSWPSLATDPTIGEHIDFSTDDILLELADSNGGSAVTDVVLISVYQTADTDARNRVVGFGAVSKGAPSNGRATINVAPDPSIRGDGYSVTGHSQSHPTTWFCRTTTRDGATFEEFFNKTSVVTGSPSTNAILDEFYSGTEFFTGEGGSNKQSDIAIAFGTRTAAELSALQEFFIQYRNL